MEKRGLLIAVHEENIRSEGTVDVNVNPLLNTSRSVERCLPRFGSKHHIRSIFRGGVFCIAAIIIFISPLFSSHFLFLSSVHSFH